MSATDTGMQAAVRILARWGATQAQMRLILGVPRALLSDVGQAALDGDQLDRISLILNIHAALRGIFSNPENLYGFVSMKNDNVFFKGRTPLDVMSDGDIQSLRDTYHHIATMAVW
ncbi:MAG: hypothetical protein RBT55_01140 [Rhodocyclaceae bacterium]|jgi:hypothetical protein|nr:hypothetical protein [Rhodocyclaceae bacterium]